MVMMKILRNYSEIKLTKQKQNLKKIAQFQFAKTVVGIPGD